MHDVTIVGGGFAGLLLGKSLSEKGIDVLILEGRKQRVLQCSGVVSREFLKHVSIPRNVVEREIDSARIISPSGFTIDLDLNALVLDRLKLDEFLEKEVSKSCSIVKERVLDLDIDEKVTVKTAESDYTSQLIVGADGPGSFVRAKMRLGVPKYQYYARFAYVKERTRSKTFEVFFNKVLSPDFFAWKIPRSIKVEYGLATTDNPNVYYQRFLKGRDYELLSEHGGVIPVGTTKSVFSRGLLLGDACGQTKPMTGGGLLYTSIASEIANEVLINALQTKDFDLSSYEDRWRDNLGEEIRKGMWTRWFYRRLSNKQIDNLIKNFPQTKKLNFDFIATQLFKIPRKELLNLGLKTVTG